nr:uncharacterized protein LOC109402795 [Aedes albopictus]
MAKLCFLCIFLSLNATVLGLGWKDFSEVSSAYFKARHIKLVTVINCFQPEANFQLMKNYLDAGFYVHIVEKFDRFNVSGNGNSGVAVDASCEDKMRDLLALNSLNEFMQTNIFWLFMEEVSDSVESKSGIPDTIRTRYNEDFRHVDVLPGSRVVIGIFQSSWKLFDVHKKHVKGGLTFKEVCYHGRNLMELSNMHRALLRLDRNSKERKNLRGYAMPTGVAITSPEKHTGISDVSDTLHDLFAKANYPLIKELTYDMNFKLNLIQVDQGGWKTNNTFTGLMGLFLNRTVELGAMGNLMRSERMEVADFTIVTLLLKTCVIFKQPPLSLVSNIFELPFSGEVWLSCLGFILICWVIMMSFRFYSKQELLTPGDALTFIIGTMCQQDIYLTAHFNSTKFLFFVAKLASFFIFTAYSATIIALLQSPSRAITSIDDLTASPLKVGAMETVYIWVYFTEAKDVQVQKLFRKKIKPFGKESLIEPDVGMQRVRDELYAFQVESNAAYQLIKRTFTPQDTCKIHELEAVKVAPFSIPVRKGSKYRELIRQRLTWQMEVGIMHRAHMIWIAQKPKCEAGVAAFNSVGTEEMRFLYKLLPVGMALAWFILGAELYRKRRLQKREANAGSFGSEKAVANSEMKMDLVYDGYLH